MEKVKSLAFIISNLTAGGAQRVVANLSQELAGLYNIYIILHDGSRVSYQFGGKLIDLQTPVAKGFLAKICNLCKRICRLRSYKKKELAQLYISFMESSNLVNILSGRLSRTVISVRNYRSRQAVTLTGKFFNLFIRCLYPKSGAVVAVSEGVREDLVRFFNIKSKPIAVIYNPVESVSLQRLMREEADEDFKPFFSGPIISTAGKLKTQKGQWHLIRAFSVVREFIPGLKLVIMGEGPLRGYLSELIKSMKLADHILLPGFQDNPFRYMARSEVFVLPSLYEGFPNVLIEAMACGVPVVSTDCRSGPREILAPHTDYRFQTAFIEYASYGILVPVCDGIKYGPFDKITPEERIMAEAVVRICNNRNLQEQYKEKSISRAEDFKAKTVAKQWISLLETI